MGGSSGGTQVRTCSVGGCDRVHWGRGYCNYHYQRAFVYGCDIEKPIRRARGMGYVQNNGYIKTTVNGRSELMHIVIAEKALGKKLPKGAEVHHVDGNRSNNDPRNLVICPNHAYHCLLHKRARELMKRSA